MSGGQVFRLASDGKSVETFDHDVSKPYAWALGHDVRPAAQALGATSCTECHSNGSPFFNSNVSTASLVTDASRNVPMHNVNGQSMGALGVFASTYPMRPLLIIIGYVSAGVLLLVLIAAGVRKVNRSV